MSWDGPPDFKKHLCAGGRPIPRQPAPPRRLRSTAFRIRRGPDPRVRGDDGKKEEERSRPISRVLSWTVIPLGASSPIRSSNLPGGTAGRGIASLFGLAPGGVCRAGLLPDSRCALTAPFHPCLCPRGPSAVCSLLHFPSARAAQALPGTVPCGARTFLGTPGGDATAWPTPRGKCSGQRAARVAAGGPASVSCSPPGWGSGPRRLRDGALHQGKPEGRRRPHFTWGAHPRNPERRAETTASPLNLRQPLKSAASH